MATTTTRGLDELRALILKRRRGLNTTTRARAEGWLNMIAKAIVEGWWTTLERLCDDDEFFDDDLEMELLKTLKAKRSDSGIMKVGVYINHQWVLKIGSNAVEEAEVYDDCTPGMRRKLVPTVPLSDFGCLQLKLKLPKSNGWSFSNKKLEREYDRMTARCDNNDVHRGNVGIWHDRLVHIDFAGA